MGGMDHFDWPKYVGFNGVISMLHVPPSYPGKLCEVMAVGVGGPS
jgi:hypothetical protein